MTKAMVPRPIQTQFAKAYYSSLKADFSTQAFSKLGQ